MKKLNFLLVGLGLLLVGACSSDDSNNENKKGIIERVPYITYPEITMEGKNTLAFRMQDKEFISHNGNEMYQSNGLKEYFTPPIPSLRAEYVDKSISKLNSLFISGREQNDEMNSIEFNYESPNLLKAGDKLTVSPMASHGAVQIIYSRLIGDEVVKFTALSGEVQILKIDLNKRIVSGIFNFKMGAADGVEDAVETIDAVDGRFDISFLSYTVER